MTTAAPPRPDVDELEQRVTDRPGEVCHLIHEEHGALCGRHGYSGVLVEYTLNPAASPCSCARARCAACAAEFTMRSAA